MCKIGFICCQIATMPCFHSSLDVSDSLKIIFQVTYVTGSSLGFFTFLVNPLLWSSSDDLLRCNDHEVHQKIC
jgi:hypothetical protein